MRTLLNRELKREAPRVANPFPPSSENLTEGMKIFRDGCAGCHGDGAIHSTWGTTSFLPRVPQFAARPPDRPEWQIYWIVRNGSRNTGMGAWKHLLTDDQIWKVTGFVSHINSLPQDVSKAWHKRRS
jgi:mono/diheme cytochrome c family protein